MSLTYGRGRGQSNIHANKGLGPIGRVPGIRRGMGTNSRAGALVDDDDDRKFARSPLGITALNEFYAANDQLQADVRTNDVQIINPGDPSVDPADVRTNDVQIINPGDPPVNPADVMDPESDSSNYLAQAEGAIPGPPPDEPAYDSESQRYDSPLYRELQDAAKLANQLSNQDMADFYALLGLLDPDDVQAAPSPNLQRQVEYNRLYPDGHPSAVGGYPEGKIVPSEDQPTGMPIKEAVAHNTQVRAAQGVTPGGTGRLAGTPRTGTPRAGALGAGAQGAYDNDPPAREEPMLTGEDPVQYAEDQYAEELIFLPGATNPLALPRPDLLLDWLPPEERLGLLQRDRNLAQQRGQRLKEGLDKFNAVSRRGSEGYVGGRRGEDPTGAAKAGRRSKARSDFALTPGGSNMQDRAGTVWRDRRSAVGKDQQTYLTPGYDRVKALVGLDNTPEYTTIGPKSLQAKAAYQKEEDEIRSDSKKVHVSSDGSEIVERDPDGTWPEGTRVISNKLAQEMQIKPDEAGLTDAEKADATATRAAAKERFWGMNEREAGRERRAKEREGRKGYGTDAQKDRIQRFREDKKKEEREQEIMGALARGQISDEAAHSLLSFEAAKQGYGALDADPDAAAEPDAADAGGDAAGDAAPGAVPAGITAHRFTDPVIRDSNNVSSARQQKKYSKWLGQTEVQEGLGNLWADKNEKWKDEKASLEEMIGDQWFGRRNSRGQMAEYFAGLEPGPQRTLKQHLFTRLQMAFYSGKGRRKSAGNRVITGNAALDTLFTEFFDGTKHSTAKKLEFVDEVLGVADQDTEERPIIFPQPLTPPAM